MDDAKALIAASPLKILACDDLDEAAKMVRFSYLCMHMGKLKLTCGGNGEMNLPIMVQESN